MKFELIGKIENIEIIAVGKRIHKLQQLRKKYGREPMAKAKGVWPRRLCPKSRWETVKAA